MLCAREYPYLRLKFVWFGLTGFESTRGSRKGYGGTHPFVNVTVGGKVMGVILPNASRSFYTELLTVAREQADNALL